ncbi:hypothetical protein ACGFNF_19780 [Micromonospora sp. NPDC048868]|uniref:hypothetical protein n=1 Tax=Micromonospora sp. NPDC048868 TaxID=3364258 RepID=UPI0037185391
MSRRAKRSINRNAVGLIAVTIVFGLAILMVLKRYDPAVITTVVTGTSLAAAELVRRFQEPTSTAAEADHEREAGS